MFDRKSQGTDPHRSRTPQPELGPRRAWYPACRRFVEPVIALMLLLLLSPVILIAAVSVKLTSPGPAFYTQTRLGRFGARFRIYKLRTMRQNAEAGTGAVWSRPGDPRVTRIGRILRDTHIDEFPQLLNVVLGHMSLVGPRPERPEIAAALEWEVPLYSERLLLPPGIAGLAQLRLPPDSDLDGVRKKLAYDLYYVRHAGPWLDLLIVGGTASLFAKSVIAACGSWLLPATPAVERHMEHLLAGKRTLQTARPELHREFESRPERLPLEAVPAK